MPPFKHKKKKEHKVAIVSTDKSNLESLEVSGPRAMEKFHKTDLI